MRKINEVKAYKFNMVVHFFFFFLINYFLALGNFDFLESNISVWCISIIVQNIVCYVLYLCPLSCLM